MKRISRTLSAALVGTVATTGLLVALPGTASADNLGQVTVNPSSGTDSTGFGGSATTACPAGTDSAFWSLEGPGLSVGEAFLGDSTNSAGTGAQSFSGASIANIETVHGGGLADGTYFVQFSCFNGPTLTDTYRANLNYTAAGSGSWNVTSSTLTPISTTTTLAADQSTVEQGTVVNLTATIAPASGSAPSGGSVEFFDGAASLGIDNTVVGGVADLAWTTSTLGARSLTAVFTPAAPSGPTDRGYGGSTSAPTSVTVTTVAARPTSAALAVSPTSGPAYQSVQLDCTVTAGSFLPNGTATFKDGASTIGSAPVTSGSVASITSTSLGAGAHTFICEFTGTAPYQNSTSNSVSATYDVVGATPDDQTVTVAIPQGALTITTPYTPAAPLHLGTAVLDAGDSTYSASATFGTAAEGYISITDTRAGNLGWTASLVAGTFSNGTSTFPGSHAGLSGLSAVQVPGNALQASDVTLTNTAPFAPGLGSLTQFANYASGLATGTANITGTFGVDQVPTSITPGLYTSTVTFTAI